MPRLTRRAAVLACALVAGAGVLCAQAPPAPPFDRDIALATFDSVWRVVRDTHYDSTLKGLDWIAVRDELRPRAAAATDVDALRDVLGAMLARLGDSHYGVIPARALGAVADDAQGGTGLAGDVGIETRSSTGRSSSCAWKRRVRPAAAASARGG